jgi:hypothetical protein
MCLTTKQKWPKIAWRPITVYKVVYKNENSYKTVYQGATIHIGKTYRESVFNMLKNRQSFIYECKKYYEFYEGLHSVTEKDSAQTIANYFDVLYLTEVVECTIPRFSLYWIRNNNYIVSNKLKYVKIL